MENKKIKYTTYLAGGIEHASNKEMKGWRNEMKEKLKSPDLLIYDPITQEPAKVGKIPGEQKNYIVGLKRSGNWKLHYDEMWKIWFGQIAQNTDLLQLFINLRMRKYIDGNTEEDLKYWGDAEAVIRSNFIIIYMPEKIKTVGTIWEEVFAMIFRIPIYLILPDCAKTDANSTLLFGNQIANNGNEPITFYNLNDCVKYIKQNHPMKEYEQEKIEEKKNDKNKSDNTKSK